MYGELHKHNQYCSRSKNTPTKNTTHQAIHKQHQLGWQSLLCFLIILFTCSISQANANPQLIATPSVVDFGNVTVGSSSTTSVLVRNVGNMNAVVVNPAGSNGRIEYFLSPSNIPPNGLANLTIRYTPTSSGSTSDLIQLINNGLDVFITVLGNGAEQPMAPPAPSGISASDGSFSNRIMVNWNFSIGANSYDVYRGTEFSAPSSTLIASSVTSLSYADTSAQPNTLYYYWVRAKNRNGVSFFGLGDSGFLQGSVLTVTIDAEADAHIEQDDPNDNLGGSSVLRIRHPSSNFGRHTFLRFNVPAINGVIESANLRIRPVTTIPTSAFYDVNINWNEFGITWNNWLNGGTTFQFFRAVSNQVGGVWQMVDVHEAVPVTGDIVTIGITTSATLGGLRYFSRQSASKPQLIIRYRP